MHNRKQLSDFATLGNPKTISVSGFYLPPPFKAPYFISWLYWKKLKNWCIAYEANAITIYLNTFLHRDMISMDCHLSQLKNERTTSANDSNFPKLSSKYVKKIGEIKFELKALNLKGKWQTCSSDVNHLPAFFLHKPALLLK